MDEILEKLNSVFPDCEVFESVEAVLKSRYPNDKKFYRHKVGDKIVVYSAEPELKHDIQPLYCNYQGKLRVVNDPVCQHHLETLDLWCWERCTTEWTIKRLRPALSAAYQQHKDCMTLKGSPHTVNGASKSLWG
jgi:hypothetical protein